jgi:capsular exopolysaccharide synthesis family protein
MAFAQDPQETGIVPPPQAVSKVPEDVQKTAKLERVRPAGNYSAIQPPSLAQDFQNAGLELAAHTVSEATGGVEAANERERVTPYGENSMIQTLNLVQNAQSTETEPPLQFDSTLAEGIADAPELEKITTSGKSIVHTVDLGQIIQKTEIELPSQAVSEVAECSANATELERVTPDGKKSAIETLGPVPNPKEIEPPPQSVSKVPESIENVIDLEQIPLEEVDVDPLSRIAFHTDPRGLAADRFRFLRMRIRELSDARKLKSLLVTSPLPLDGKSTVSLNLATALADGAQNAVLLLEADLYHPTLAQRLGLKAGPGLAECLASGLAALSVVRRLAPLGWYLLPAGSQLGNPSDLLHGDGFARIMRALSPHFKWIVVDSPPIGPVTDSLALARETDASLLVVRAGRTPCEAVDTVIEALGTRHVIGVVLNGVEGLERLYSKYNTYYAPSVAAKSHGRKADR